MEFSEKMQQLRKEKELTQEQLAEQLYVSRTAISKWESGKGYPNIESLKSISKLFSVSIDDLLSGEELISLAASENRSNIGKILSLIYGIVDIMAIAFIFLPFYGQPDGGGVRSVNLFAYTDVSVLTRMIYLGILTLIFASGISEIIIQFFESKKISNIVRTCSIVLHALAILFFALTRQPYVTSFLFMFFIIKIVLMIKTSLDT